MQTKVWNRQYLRCLRAMRGKDAKEKRRIKKAWLAVQQRRTGKTCFFQPW